MSAKQGVAVCGVAVRRAPDYASIGDITHYIIVQYYTAYVLYGIWQTVQGSAETRGEKP